MRFTMVVRVEIEEVRRVSDRKKKMKTRVFEGCA